MSLQISFNDGHWSATGERLALNAHNNRFRSLDRLLAELATIGIRSLPGFSWEELPPVDGFSPYLFHAEIDRYLSSEPKEHWGDYSQRGCHMICAARLDNDRDWRFLLSLTHDVAWRDRMVEHFKERLGFPWVASREDPGCQGGGDPVAYIRQRLYSLTDDLHAAIAAG